MKKFFTLTLALMASFSLWADPTLPADGTPSGILNVLEGDENIATVRTATANSKKYYVYNMGTEIRTNALKNKLADWVAGPANDGGSTKTMSWADDVTDAEKYLFSTSGSISSWGIRSNRYCGIRVINCSEAAVTTISADNKNDKDLLLQVYIKNGDSWDFVETIGTGLYNTSKAYVLTATLDESEEYVVLLTGTTTSGSQALELRLASSTLCDDSHASIIDDAVGFVGDAIDLEFTSENTSERDTVVKLDDGTATKGTDYTFVAEGFKPLTAGEFEITISQVKDGTHCEVEESVTLTISQKTPVTDFTIPASSSARKGQEVNLSITDLDAAATEIGWILAGDTVSKTEDYVFTPSAAGNYVFTAYAANVFNTSGAVEKSCTISVAISSDATLSALSVAGKTLSPSFSAAETAYSVSGQLGVYELLNVTATATDAPYATVDKVDNKTNAVTITVTAENESTQDYTISYTRKAATTLTSIGETTTWDWADAGSGTDEWSGSTYPTNTEEFNFADVLISPEETFNADALSGIAQFAKRGGDYNCFQGTKIKFNTTVPGSVKIYYQNTSNRNEDGRRWVDINGTKTGDGAIDQKAWYLAEGNVAAGDVVITFEDKDAKATMLRINKIVFTEAPKYAITCDDDGHGEVIAAPTSTYAGYPVNLTTNPATGYELATLQVLKASDDSDITDDVLEGNVLTMPAYAVKVVATFSAIPYEVTYNANGGECATASATFTGTALVLPEATAPDYSHTFDGWYSAATEGTKVGNAGANFTPTKDTTLYAYYAEKDAAPIYWKLNEVVVDAAEVTYGSTPYALPTLDKPNSLTVALASSATDVAEFEGSTLNIKKAGTANISATYTATEDGDYRTTIVSYALTVKSGSGTALDNTADEVKAVKFLENGQLFIRRGEKVYTITGELVK